VLAVTLLSIVMALLPLPAALLLVGPLNPRQCGYPTYCLPRIGELQTKMAAQLPAPKTHRGTRDSSVEGEHQVASETGTGPEEPSGLSAQHSQPSEPFPTRPSPSKAAAIVTPPTDDNSLDADNRLPAPLTRSLAGVTGVAPAAQQPIRPRAQPAPESPQSPSSHSTHSPAALTPNRHMRISETEFDIGTETPLARMCSHEGYSQTTPMANSTGTQPEELTDD